MSRLRSLSRGGRLLLALVVGGVVFAIASALQASIPDQPGARESDRCVASDRHRQTERELHVLGDAAELEPERRHRTNRRDGANRADGTHGADRPYRG